MQPITKGLAAALLATCLAWSQSGRGPTFEVASVKPAAPCCAPGQWPNNRPGVDGVNFRYVTLWWCITYAYGMKSYQVFGPDWLKDGRFDIIAKGPAGTARDQLPKLMQALLAERFKLQVHQEKREIAGLALIVGKGGPKLKQSTAEGAAAAAGAHFGMSASSTGSERMEVTNALMSNLANTLSGLLGRPVFDKTGLTDRYDFVLEFSRSERAGPKTTGGYGEPPPMPPPPPGGEPGLSVYSSIQQLGLKLDPQKIPIDVIVIDHAERSPTEN